MQRFQKYNLKPGKKFILIQSVSQSLMIVIELPRFFRIVNSLGTLVL